MMDNESRTYHLPNSSLPNLEATKIQNHTRAVNNLFLHFFFQIPGQQETRFKSVYNLTPRFKFLQSWSNLRIGGTH